MRPPHHLVWNGDSFEGRDVLVRCEHGLGDTLQFIRYVRMLRKIASSVSVLLQPALLSLFESCDDFGDVRNGWSDERPRLHEIEIEVMELAYAMRSTVETLPREVPYLPLARIEQRASRLPRIIAHGDLRVGLLWAASDWDGAADSPGASP